MRAVLKIPTGFMRPAILLLLFVLSTGVGAADVALIGLIGDKAAVLAVDGGDPKTVKVGQKWHGITVISVERGEATVEIDAQAADRQSITLAADSRGHFITQGAINGNPVRFLVDTGATVVALPAAEAMRLGIDYRKGQPGMSSTAGGMVSTYRVRFDSVRLGDIEVLGVDGVVLEQGLDIALLGMSFLNRVEMKRDGHTMVLIRRF